MKRDGYSFLLCSAVCAACVMCAPANSEEVPERIGFKADTVELTVEKIDEPTPAFKITEVFTRPCFSPGQARLHIKTIPAENIRELNIIQIQGQFAVRVSLHRDAPPDQQFSTDVSCDGNAYTNPIEISTLIVVGDDEDDAMRIWNFMGSN